jgi:hypothetical protein
MSIREFIVDVLDFELDDCDIKMIEMFEEIKGTNKQEHVPLFSGHKPFHVGVDRHIVIPSTTSGTINLDGLCKTTSETIDSKLAMDRASNNHGCAIGGVSNVLLGSKSLLAEELMKKGEIYS